MTRYMSLMALRSDVLAHADNNSATILIRAFNNKSDIPPYLQDILSCECDFDIWDMECQEAVDELAEMITENPVYRMSLEIVLDNALDEAQSSDNQNLMRYLEKAFGYQGIPQRREANSGLGNAVIGNLKHALLAHLSHAELADIYINFLNSIDDDLYFMNYGLQAVIKINREMFYKKYDGYSVGNITFLRFDKVSSQACRLDVDKKKTIEDYICDGKDQSKIDAEKMDGDGLSYIRAWLVLDRQQSISCKLIHKILSLLDNIPLWIYLDIYQLVFNDVRKQSYARKIMKLEGVEKTLKQAKNIYTAIENNAEGRFAKELGALAQDVEQDKAYSGEANDFCIEADKREVEAERISSLMTV